MRTNEKRGPTTLMKTKMSRKKGQLCPLAQLSNIMMQAETQKKDHMPQGIIEKSCGWKRHRRSPLPSRKY